MKGHRGRDADCVVEPGSKPSKVDLEAVAEFQNILLRECELAWAQFAEDKAAEAGGNLDQAIITVDLGYSRKAGRPLGPHKPVLKLFQTAAMRPKVWRIWHSENVRESPNLVRQAGELSDVERLMADQFSAGAESRIGAKRASDPEETRFYDIAMMCERVRAKPETAVRSCRTLIAAIADFRKRAALHIEERAQVKQDLKASRKHGVIEHC